ncbi:hypothetical protein [Streptomyces sp. ICBB 8177]|uniref:hypothetical protein n=1 Tax=Streptomyces sp. ICBB 8177 TaxID=563922 RepID=UPI000D68326D|nr:hypothetical protein [Streptomyces sp. ICBB 8177]PWI41146.1 hypothetical protein CK485_27790 [Streptomyces sp. ICBB 8177]
MHTYVGPHRAETTDDFLELAIGTPLALWLGEDGESEEERAARLDAAADILADDPAIVDRTTRLAVESIGATMPDLLRLAPPVAAPTPVRVPPVRRRVVKGVAA